MASHLDTLEEPPNIIEEEDMPDPLSTRLREAFPIPPSIHTILFPADSEPLMHLQDARTPEPMPDEQFDSNKVTFYQKKFVLSDTEAVQIKSLLAGMESPPFSQLEHLYKPVLQASQSGYLTFAVDPKAPARIPFWSLTYWHEVETVITAKRNWAGAEEWLRKHAKGALLALKVKPWKLEMPENMGTLTEHLAVFCSSSWVRGEQLNLVAWMLRKMLDSNSLTGSSSLHVVGPFFACLLITTYRTRRNTYLNEPKQSRWLHSLGSRLQNGELKTLGFNVGLRLGANGVEVAEKAIDANHWVTVKVDLSTQSLYFGDSWSQDHEIPEETFLAPRSQTAFLVVFLLPTVFCMPSSPRDFRSSTRQSVQRDGLTFYWLFILQKHTPKAKLDTILPPSLSSFNFTCPKSSTASLEPAPKDKKPANKPSSAPSVPKAGGKRKERTPRHNPNKRVFLEAFGMAESKAVEEEIEEENSELGSDSDGEGGTREIKVDLSNWVDAPLKRKEKGGRGPDPMFYRCLTPGCTSRRSNLNRRRWLAHAWEGCPRISNELRKDVGVEMMKLAPSMVAGEVEPGVPVMANKVDDSEVKDENGNEEAFGLKKLKTQDGAIVVQDPNQPSVVMTPKSRAY